MSALDPIAALLDGRMVPPLPVSLADRIVAEAQRRDRVPAPAPLAPPRRRLRRWTRRGVWTTVVAVNLIVASAVAAAIGGGVIDPHRIALAAHRLVEHIRHPHADRALAVHPPVAVTHRIATATSAPRPVPIMAPALSHPTALPPLRGAIDPRPPLRVAAVAVRPRLLAAPRPRVEPARRLHSERPADRIDHPRRIAPVELPRRDLADRRPAPITEPALRAEPPAARTDPAPAPFAGRWRQRGWRAWQNRQLATGRPADSDRAADGLPRADGIEREHPQADAMAGRPQQRAGVAMRPGRRFGGGMRRGGGGGRRRR